MRVAVVIPALNEAESIGRVVRELSRAVLETQVAGCRVIVADNGSTDGTAEEARRAGATVVHALRRGYGTACLAALAALVPGEETVLFADGDGSDDPGDVAALLGPLQRDEADLVLGSRALGERLGLTEEGALTVPQRFGNQLATTLLRLVYGYHFSDLGPLRAIRREALELLGMDDPDFGWTVQMQARAARAGLRVREVPVRYRRRTTGESKVSGNLRGSVLAGTIILSTLAREALPARWLRRHLPAQPGRGRGLAAPGGNAEGQPADRGPADAEDTRVV